MAPRKAKCWVHCSVTSGQSEIEARAYVPSLLSGGVTVGDAALGAALLTSAWTVRGSSCAYSFSFLVLFTTSVCLLLGRIIRNTFLGRHMLTNLALGNH